MLKCVCVCIEGSDGGETERLEELPLCSCRMEAPRVDGASQQANRQCMATESINGEVRAWVCVRSYDLCVRNHSVGLMKVCLCGVMCRKRRVTGKTHSIHASPV